MDVLPDRFKLPPSMCTGDISGQCNAKGGKLVGRKNGCTCECMEDKSTFGIHNSWKCIDNTIFHDLGGELFDFSFWRLGFYRIHLIPHSFIHHSLLIHNLSL